MLGKEYNAFEHLWKTIFPFDAKEKIMVMLAAYFDESRSSAPAPRVYTVGGYISTVDKWTEFSKEWQAFLDSENLPPFSMKRFANKHDKIYGTWSESKKKVFIRILHKIIKKYYDHSFSTSVVLDAYDQLTAPQKFGIGPAHAFTAIDCLKNVKTYAESIGLTEPINYVFEKGSTHDKLLYKIFCADLTEAQQEFYHIGSFTFDTKRIQALQAADLLVYETRKEMCRRKAEMVRPIRQSIVNLHNREKDDWYFYDQKNLETVVSFPEFAADIDRDIIKSEAEKADRRGFFNNT